ncbi:MAG: leucine-rich repeat protein, partial [Bacillota bacterium]
AVEGANNLKNIFVQDENELYFDDDGVFYSEDRLLHYPKDRTHATYAVVNGTKYIEENVFSNTMLLHIVLPQSLIEANQAFENALFNSVSMYADIPIGNIFEDTNIIRELIVKGEKVTDNFACNSKMLKVTIEDGVREIGVDAFKESLLDEIIFPSSLKIIKAGAFKSCQFLDSVTFEDEYTLTEVGMESFYDTLWYQNQTQNQIIYIGNIAYGYSGEMAEDTAVAIREGTTSIADAAFKDMTNIDSISLPFSLEKIGEYAFENLENLTQITLNENLTTISEGAFYNNSSLETVMFSDSIEYIGDYAFSSATSLSSIILPRDLKHIGKEAFYNNTSLTAVLIPEDVEYIGENAFYGGAALDSIGFENINNLENMGQGVFDNTLWYNNSSDGEVIISGTNAIYKYKGEMSSQYFMESDITRILPYAFSNQSSLSTLRLNEDLKWIGDYAFENCENLSEVYNISTDMELNHIGKGAFSECSSLSRFTIPRQLASFDLSVFENCNSLSVIMVDDESNSPYYNVSGGILYNNDLSELIFVPMGLSGSITIENTITEIPQRAFENRNLITSIVIPREIEKIGERAFANTALLTNVEYESNSALETIDKKAFYNCAVEIMKIPRRVNFIGEDAFNYSSGVEIVFMGDIPPQIEGDISSNTNFYAPRDKLSLYRDNIDFTNIFPSRVRVSFMVDMKEYRYYEVAYGKAISDIPKAPQKTGYVGYWEEDSLNLVKNETNEEFIDLYEDVVIKAIYTRKTYTVTFNHNQGGVTHQENYKYNDSLSDIPEAVSAQHYMFLFWTEDTDTLDEFGLQKMPARNIELYAVWYEFDYTLHSESQTYSVRPATSNQITPETIIIPEEYDLKPVTKIAANAFEDNENITSISIPNSIEKIGEFAFASSTLKNLIVEQDSNLSEIGEHAFSSSQIENFSFDGELIIGQKAFYDTDKLKDINININFMESGSYIFENAISLQTASVFTEQTGGLSASVGLFSDCHSLTNVTLPNEIEYINENTFFNCYNLMDINLESVYFIHNSAFENCFSLESIELNEVEYIGQRAFYGCENLQNIDIGNGETSATIDEFAFYGCDSLSHFVVPSNTNSINEAAFENTNIDHIYVMESDDPAFGSMNLSIASDSLPTDTIIYVGDNLDYNQNQWQQWTVQLYRGIVNDFVVDIDNMILRYIGQSDVVEMPERIGTDWISGIKKEVFANSQTVEQLTLTPSLIQFIDNGEIFSYASGLNYIDSPDSVNGVLYNQDKSTVIAYPVNKDNSIFEIDSTVTAFADYAFMGAKKLTSLIIDNPIPPQIGQNTFALINSNMKIYVPSNAVDTYKDADIWQNYEDIIYPDVIGYNDFVFVEHAEGLELSQYLGSSQTISIPLSLNGMNVVSIGDYAFYNTPIKSVDIPTSVKYIGNYAFANSINLESIT